MSFFGGAKNSAIFKSFHGRQLKRLCLGNKRPFVTGAGGKWNRPVLFGTASAAARRPSGAQAVEAGHILQLFQIHSQTSDSQESILPQLASLFHSFSLSCSVSLFHFLSQSYALSLILSLPISIYRLLCLFICLSPALSVSHSCLLFFLSFALCRIPSFSVLF